MLHTSVGQALLNHALPEDMRDHARVLDKKGIAALFDDLAHRHPEQYRDVAKKLTDVARDVSYGTGGFSFGLQHMGPVPAAEQIKKEAMLEIRAIRARRDLSEPQKEQAVIHALQSRQKPIEDAVFGHSMAEKNPLAMQVLNVGRGNKTSLKGLRSGDLMYEDHHGDPIPIPIMSSYSKGLKPVEYWAAGFGARKGVWDVKRGTAESGFFGKQLVQAAHRLVVTGDDEDAHDPASRVGLPVSTDDSDSAGSLLAHPVGPYPRDTVLTPNILGDMKAAGHARILVRSPMVGGPRDGGVFARDVGVRERGGIAPPGDFVGTAAAQALAEKLTQGQLGSKHAGGVAGAGAATSGFGYINSLIQIPKTFPGGATHARRDGRVSGISEAPQGGSFVEVSGERHYVPHGLSAKVAVGDAVEAGDALSDGIENPAELVAHKGIGEGRARFVPAFHQAYRNSGMSANRRNIELLARGLIDHVEVTDEFGDHVPGDVTSYQHIERNWEPRDGARSVSPTQAVGKYLESPSLHHTVGTKIKPSMMADFRDFGVGSLLVHDEPPPFKPVMIRGMANLHHDPDWMTRHLGSNLQKGTLEAVHRNRTSDTAGTSFVPAVANNRLNFGRTGLTKGWKPEDIKPIHQPKIKSVLDDF